VFTDCDGICVDFVEVLGMFSLVLGASLVRIFYTKK